MKHCRALDGFFQKRYQTRYNISDSPHIYVFRHADYEYTSKNCQLADFHGKDHENLMKIMVFGVYLRKY